MKIVGYDIDIAVRFCEAYGYGLELVDMSFDAVLPSVQSGKCDFGGSGITVTEERAESVLFSEPNFSGGTVMAVMKAEEPAAGGIASVAQLNAPSIRLGLPQASAADAAVRDELPEAQVVHYNDNLLGYMDVATGRLDAYVYDEVQMKIALENGIEGVRMLDDFLGPELKICVGVSPVSNIPELEDKVNRFIAEMRDSGVLEDMRLRWIWDAERTMPEIELPENPAYHLVVATSGIVMPFSYYEDNALTGYDIEMAYRFAQWLGADVKFGVYDYGGIVSAATSGKVDVIMANLQYTEERTESGLFFSDEVYAGRLAVLVRDGAAAQTAAAATEAEDTSFWGGIKSSFHKTFIREGR